MEKVSEVSTNLLIIFYVGAVGLVSSGYLVSIIEENMRYVSIMERHIMKEKVLSEKIKDLYKKFKDIIRQMKEALVTYMLCVCCCKLPKKKQEKKVLTNLERILS